MENNKGRPGWLDSKMIVYLLLGILKGGNISHHSKQIVQKVVQILRDELRIQSTSFKMGLYVHTLEDTIAPKMVI